MSVCSVIVTYCPDVEVIENINILTAQVDEIVIVDNTPDSYDNYVLRKIINNQKVFIINNLCNIGLAAALNIGIKAAKNNGHEWVITFDQDSIATSNMLKTMFDSYALYPEKNSIFGMVPQLANKKSKLNTKNYFLKTSNPDLPYEVTQLLITSGNLIKTSVFDEVGYFKEELFIDYIDTEFFLRCIKHNYKLLLVKNAILFHNVGSPTYHKLLWRTVGATNHSVLRRYYIARNAVYVSRKYFFMNPILVISYFKGSFKNTVAGLLFEENKIKKMIAVLFGIFDGLFNRLGECNYPNLKQ